MKVKSFILVSLFNASIAIANESALPAVNHIESSTNIEFANVKQKCSKIVFYGSWCTSCTKTIRSIMNDDSNAKDSLCLISEDNNKEDALSYFEGKDDLKSLISRTYLDSEGALGTALQIDGVPAVIGSPKP